MDNIKLSERLDRIEKLLVANKKVLTFDEACDYTGISKSYLYKLTSQNEIPLEKLIRYELACRGYDAETKWVGFDKAKQIWLK